MKIIDRLPHERGRDYAARVIKYNIVRAILEPGAMLSAVELARELNLSKTPVNEALQELSNTGVIEILPQVGSRVSYINYDIVDEACFTRMILEEAIMDIVCSTITPEQIRQLEISIKLQELYANSDKDMMMELDDQFHKMMYTFSNRSRSYAAIQNLEIYFDRVRALSFNVANDNEIVQEHKSLLAAIVAKEPELAKQMVRKHLSMYKKHRESICKTFPQYITQTNPTNQ